MDHANLSVDLANLASLADLASHATHANIPDVTLGASRVAMDVGPSLAVQLAILRVALAAARRAVTMDVGPTLALQVATAAARHAVIGDALQHMDPTVVGVN